MRRQLKCAHLFKIPLTTYYYGRASYCESGVSGVPLALDDNNICDAVTMNSMRIDGSAIPSFDYEILNFQMTYLFHHRVVLSDAHAYALRRDINARAVETVAS
jgi:hypothetical protein